MRAAENELLDRFGLLLRILFVRGAPIYLDVEIVFLAEFLGGLFRTHASGLEDGITLRFGDEADGVILFRLSERGSAREC